MANISVGIVQGTGTANYIVAASAAIAKGKLVSFVNGSLHLTVATDRTSAQKCVGVSVGAFAPPPDRSGMAGEKIAIGNDLALLKSGSVWKLWKRKSKQISVGKATSAGLAGQTISYTDGLQAGVAVATSSLKTPGTVVVDLGVSLAPNTFYCASATPGGICPVSDLSAGMYFTLAGWSNAAGDFVVNVVPLDILM